MAKNKKQTKGNGKGRVLASVAAILIFAAVAGGAVYMATRPERNKLAETAPQTESASEAASESEVTPSTVTDDDPEWFKEFSDEPVTPEEAYEHAEIVSKTEVGASEHIMTETEAIAFFKDRGLGNLEVMVSYDMDGTYFFDREAADGSTDKHPAYEASYTAANGDLWQLFLHNGKLFAYPVSYNFNDNKNKAAVVISESESIVSYDSATNTYYEIIPDGTEVVVKVVEKIDAATIDEISGKGVGRL